MKIAEFLRKFRFEEEENRCSSQVTDKILRKTRDCFLPWLISSIHASRQCMSQQFIVTKRLTLSKLNGSSVVVCCDSWFISYTVKTISVKLRKNYWQQCCQKFSVILQTFCNMEIRKITDFLWKSRNTVTDFSIKLQCFSGNIRLFSTKLRIALK